MAIRIGLIGCGEYCSKTHAQVLSEKVCVQIAAISECVFPGELARRQQQFRIPHAFSSYEEMLHSVKLDGVVISTPHTRHFIQARCCLELGLHVLVDKPPACRSEEVQALVNLADLAGCHLLVASQRRYGSLFCRLRDKVQNGELGELKLVEFHYGRSKHPEFATSWRNDPTLSGGGVLFDAGYHVLDSLLWITNRHPLRVHGSLERKGTKVETSASFILELEGGVSANISMHLEMPPHMVREEIGFFGSEGALLYQYVSLPDNASSARIITVRGGHQSYEEIQRDRGIDQAPAKNLIGAILDQDPAKSSGRESIETVRTIEWIYRELDKLDHNMEASTHETGRPARERFHQTSR